MNNDVMLVYMTISFVGISLLSIANCFYYDENTALGKFVAAVIGFMIGSQIFITIYSIYFLSQAINNAN